MNETHDLELRCYFSGGTYVSMVISPRAVTEISPPPGQTIVSARAGRRELLDQWPAPSEKPVEGERG